MAVFARDSETGELSFLEMESDGAAGVTGLVAPRALSLSSDGESLYVAAFGSDSVVQFSRNASSGDGGFGQLTFVGSIADGDGWRRRARGRPGGGRRSGSALLRIREASTSTWRARTTTRSRSSERDAGTGVLTFLHVTREGIAGTTGLGKPVALVLSEDAQHLYAAAGGSDAVTAFDRDWDGGSETGTGALTFVESEADGSGTVAPGSLVTYEIRVTNHGPSSVQQARVVDIFPGDLENVSFTCQTTGGATCFDGAGDLDQLVNLPVGSSVLFRPPGRSSPASREPWSTPRR